MLFGIEYMCGYVQKRNKRVLDPFPFHLGNAFIYKKVKVSSEKESEDILQIFRADEVVSSENRTRIQYLVKMKN